MAANKPNFFPSKRTARKFTRDTVVAAIVAALTFVADNTGTLNLSPEASAMMVGVALMLMRYIRDDVKEPESVNSEDEEKPVA
jgi:hypothetical protein